MNCEQGTGRTVQIKKQIIHFVSIFQRKIYWDKIILAYIQKTFISIHKYIHICKKCIHINFYTYVICKHIACEKSGRLAKFTGFQRFLRGFSTGFGSGQMSILLIAIQSD